ncbi:MAG: response regulator [Candidatus Latescibacteria bacterium]|jgi:two-component system, OmpR family, response regulator RegX3|nr:response regulator [Candidatus Latescibacterota bacterium]
MNTLIVDDDQALIQFLSQAVVARGHSAVYTATSAEMALEEVLLRDYHLITLDIQMPGASGLEILPLIRNMCPHAIIAIISGHIPDEVIDDLAGCADVLLDKPVALDDFFELVDAAYKIRTYLYKIRGMGRAHLQVRDS